MSALRWLALRVAANCERIVAEEITGAGHVGYCPMGAKLVWWKGKRRLPHGERREFPVFSRYVFAASASEEPIARRLFRRIDAILGDASGPIEIPARAIEHIKTLEKAGEWDETKSWRAKSPFQPGNPVKIKEGPFTGIEATVSELASESRIWLLINLFGKLNPVEVDTSVVEMA